MAHSLSIQNTNKGVLSLKVFVKVCSDIAAVHRTMLVPKHGFVSPFLDTDHKNAVFQQAASFI